MMLLMFGCVIGVVSFNTRLRLYYGVNQGRMNEVKTRRSQKLRMLPTHRKLLQSKAIAIENDLRGTLQTLDLSQDAAHGVPTAQGMETSGASHDSDV
jgi:hypothetical protein